MRKVTDGDNRRDRSRPAKRRRLLLQRFLRYISRFARIRIIPAAVSRMLSRDRTPRFLASIVSGASGESMSAFHRGGLSFSGFMQFVKVARSYAKIYRSVQSDLRSVSPYRHLAPGRYCLLAAYIEPRRRG